MNKRGRILTSFSLRILGAICGALGFILLAYGNKLLGTALIGIVMF